MSTNTKITNRASHIIRRDSETGQLDFIMTGAATGGADYNVGPISETAISLIKAHQDAALLLLSSLRADDFFGDEGASATTDERFAAETLAAVRLAYFRTVSEARADELVIPDYAEDSESDDLRNLLRLPSEMLQVLAKGYGIEAPADHVVDTNDLIRAHKTAFANKIAAGNNMVAGNEQDKADYHAAARLEEVAAVEIVAAIWERGQYAADLINDYLRVADAAGEGGTADQLSEMSQEAVMALRDYYRKR